MSLRESSRDGSKAEGRGGVSGEGERRGRHEYGVFARNSRWTGVVDRKRERTGEVVDGNVIAGWTALARRVARQVFGRAK